MASLSPSVVHHPLQYHEIPKSRLAAVTSAGLQAAGIPLEAIGTLEGGKQVISSCFAFSPFARKGLPPSAGGNSEAAELRLSSASATFLASTLRRPHPSPERTPRADLSPRRFERLAPAPAIQEARPGAVSAAHAQNAVAHGSRPQRAPNGQFKKAEIQQGVLTVDELATDLGTVSMQDPQGSPQASAAELADSNDEGDEQHGAQQTPATVPKAEAKSEPPAKAAVPAKEPQPASADLACAPDRRTPVSAASHFDDDHDPDPRRPYHPRHHASPDRDGYDSDRAFRSSRRDGDPKDAQVHIAASRENDLARAKSMAVLSLAESRFTLIAEELRNACGIAQPAVLADFPAVALEEAAIAFQHQLSGLAILQASARAHTGQGHALALSYLSDRFDEKASYLIKKGRLIIRADTTELAMHCIPVLQIALHIYYSQHSPVATAVAAIMEAAKSVKLIKGTAFSPGRGLDAFFAAHAQARRDRLHYNAHDVYGSLMSAMNIAGNVHYEGLDEDDQPLHWKQWVQVTSRAYNARLQGGRHDSVFRAADVDNLSDALRAFADAHDLEQCPPRPHSHSRVRFWRRATTVRPSRRWCRPLRRRKTPEHAALAPTARPGPSAKATPAAPAADAARPVTHSGPATAAPPPRMVAALPPVARARLRSPQRPRH